MKKFWSFPKLETGLAAFKVLRATVTTIGLFRLLGQRHNKRGPVMLTGEAVGFELGY